MGKELFYYVLVAALFVVGCLYLSVVCRKVGIQQSEQVGFSGSLESLRGIAAFLVFGAHSTMYFGFAPKQVAAASMGEIGVLLFFMLTGHLFWGQIKAGKFDGNTFFIKRIRRLVPIMMVVIATFLLLDWVRAGFPVPSISQLIAGFRNFGFGFGKVLNSTGDVNDVFSKDMYLRINTIWTLRWEWMFYLFMPLLATLGSLPKVTALAVTIILMFMDPFSIMQGGTDAVFIMAFWLGALSRSMEDYRNGVLSFLFSRHVSSCLLLLGVLATGVYLFGGELSQKNVRVPIMILTVFPVFFYFVASKYHPDRLTWRPLQQAGKVSYSFYLWHLGVNYYVVRGLSLLFDQPQSLICFVVSCTVMMLIGLTLSAISYRYVEEPFLKKSTHITT
ncbi:Peptidoglycan/LPS O-acetylase OafA/YrhL, contains acyltransferase and SGNH-hydrolase domains [Pseudomonas sp. NFIX51]|uniref:acyltransferase family protein n=1 Tax=unclassified Pseudomonas TaxID=196821 RepID=UPI0008C610BE|nr:MULTISPECIES: acyltransferase [unclassified Pseudomonas]SEL45794.1 Peptidoglycan/LPS O-acetylase OafA/YrhL, contains acyltransferase and SGNH-hydrolase domains [Pseudomonas sp. NFACC41-3]SMH49848.1 Peptidoglycan/LPS O-acetylase OafA/YrhL, contains acyltransferase and SGNH-hydrolase domains [Pseudomonas sp. NFIX51]